jgi:hypothetical protein
VEHCTAGSGCTVTVEEEDGNGHLAAPPPMSSCAAHGDRARAVLLASNAHGGGGSCSWVDVAWCGEVAAAVRSWGSTLWRCGSRCGREEGWWEAWRGRHAGGAADRGRGDVSFFYKLR